MALAQFWFLLIGFFFVGYFVLEGFDFGVGILLPVLGRDDVDRRVMINTIGPVWDANETWVIVAGASMFAAFPEWYASMFSGFYLPLLAILVALIIRGVAFEYRGKVDDAGWRRRWDACIFAGSVLPALLWGVAFANVVRGLPLDADGNYTGTVATLLNPYALLGGLAFLALFSCHGAIFVALRTTGAIRHDARALGTRLGLVAIVVLGSFGAWTALARSDGAVALLAAIAVVALAGALVANGGEREGVAFALTAASVVALLAMLAVALYPDVLPSTTDPAFSLTVASASSTPSTLRAMSWIALLALPFVIAYQAWTYWVFRGRIGRANIPAKLPHGAGTQLRT